MLFRWMKKKKNKVRKGFATHRRKKMRKEQRRMTKTKQKPSHFLCRRHEHKIHLKIHFDRLWRARFSLFLSRTRRKKKVVTFYFYVLNSGSYHTHQQIDSTTTEWKLIESSKNWKINGQHHSGKQQPLLSNIFGCHVTKIKARRKETWISTRSKVGTSGEEVSWTRCLLNNINLLNDILQNNSLYSSGADARAPHTFALHSIVGANQWLTC